MAIDYKIGDKLYLPVTVINGASQLYPIKVEFFCDIDTVDNAAIANKPGLLLTEEEIYANRRTADTIEHLTDMMDYGRQKYDEIAELKTRNAELEALLKEVTATRDEAIRQNNELMAASDKLKDTLVDRTKDVQHLTEENDKWKAECKRLNTWYMEVNRTASEAAEANDELKAKIAELRNRVGEQLAQIQDLNAEIHFLKAARDKQKDANDELKGRYDELDSVNHEQAEKIRKLDKALTDLKQQNDKLQDENTNLSFLLEAQPEEESTKTLHVVLNDGTEIEFRRYTSYDYRTDINMFVVKDGEKYIAGFLRGDKPTNIAYWWTE